MILLFCVACLPASAEEVCAEFTVRFRVNSSVVDLRYSDNGAVLTSLFNTLDSIAADSTLSLTGVRFAGSASPDGSFRLNSKLSEKRLDALRSYVCTRRPLPDSLISPEHRVTDWSLLRSMVEASDMPNRDEVLDIIDNVPEQTTASSGRVTAERKDRLQRLRGGVAWRYMLRYFYPSLRNADCVVLYWVEIKPAPEPEPVPTPEPEPLPVDTVATDTTAPKPRERRPFYMSLSTNMLFDALAIPSAEAEFYVGHNMSVAANWMYGWWNSNRHHRYWRMYGGELSFRYWFGSAARRKPLTGHHVGVFGQALIYDFEFGGKGQMAGKPGASMWESCNYGFGIDYGYSLPISSRLNIDFTIGVGYLGGKYYEYRPIDGHYVWLSTKRRNWFGPTRAMVSLVWLLGHGNRNEKGGGL